MKSAISNYCTGAGVSAISVVLPDLASLKSEICNLELAPVRAPRLRNRGWRIRLEGFCRDACDEWGWGGAG